MLVIFPKLPMELLYLLFSFNTKYVKLMSIICDQHIERYQLLEDSILELRGAKSKFFIDNINAVCRLNLRFQVCWNLQYLLHLCCLKDFT